MSTYDPFRFPRPVHAALLLAFLLLAPACGDKAGDEPTRPLPAGIAIQEGERPFGGFAISSGQPTEARLLEVAPHMAVVANFRMAGESELDEKKIVEGAGGTYFHVGVDKERLQSFGTRMAVYAIFDEAKKDPKRMSFFHCGSGNRVGALWALYRAEHEKKPIEEAIADGKAAGLTSLEPLVRKVLENSPALGK